MKSNLFLYILIKDATFHVSVNLDCINVHFGRFDISYSLYRVWKLETISFIFNLGLLQYCILIIYVMKTTISLCIYGFVYVSNFLCKKQNKTCPQTTSRSSLQSPLQPYTGSVYLYKCKKIMMKVFFGLFLMDIAVGGGLRLI